MNSELQPQNIIPPSIANGNGSVLKDLFRDNMTFPKCTVDEVKRAPAAQLNIVRRGTRWAEQMRKEFGTDYIREQFFYSGIDSIETFLRDVASKFDLDGEADEVIHRENKKWK